MNDPRPHSRNKKVGSGSARVTHGNRVSSSGVGFSGRGSSSSRVSGTSSAPMRGLPFTLNLKTILILAAVLLVAFFVLKNCGLDLGSLSDYTTEGWGSLTQDYSYADNEHNDASYEYVNTSVSRQAREKYYQPKAGDDVTVMIYMCGTDLESKYGMATKDLNEMLRANLSDKVHIVICTGGCSRWQTSRISNTYNQIWTITDGELKEVDTKFSTTSMTDPTNLSNFIRFAHQRFPAERNILIFWDHGGGSVSGYGYDEKKPDASSMTLAKIDIALRDGDMKFDFIGFDACLMATLETDLVCNRYADYMIASEESEPGTGWYYTNWLTMLSKNTAEPTVNIGKRIIDDFVASCCSSSTAAQVTLSIVDLSELNGTVPEALASFAESTTRLVSSDAYTTVSNARASSRQFSAKNKLNQVDLIDLAEKIGTAEAKELAKVLKSCVKYNKTTISRANGISIYFPYETTSSMNSAVASMNAIGQDKGYSECMNEYTKCIRSFASLQLGGQVVAASSQGGSASGDLLGSILSSFSSGSSSTSPLSVLGGLFGSSSAPAAGNALDVSGLLSLLGSFSGRSMPSGYEWADTALISEKKEQIVLNALDPSRIRVQVKNGRNVLELADNEWALIQSAELNVFAKDGSGYIDLGLDNVFEWLDAGQTQMLMEYDGTWLTLNGNVCAYYLVSDVEQKDGSWVTTGRIPAQLNGETVNLQVIFDNNNPYGTVTGAYPFYTDGTDVQAKGEIEICSGDRIQLLCDYYREDGTLDGTYTLGAPFTVPSRGLTLENLRIEADDLDVMYRLTDIYGNAFWIPVP